jgi:hypothetical protein
VPPQPSPPAVEEIPVIESTMPDVAAITVASYFSPEQFAALRRLSELIAPAMNGAPGALEVETPEFLDFLLGESPADRQALYRTGLDELKSRAQQRFGASFARLTATRANGVLAPLRETWSANPDPFTQFLQTAKQDILQATQAWIADPATRCGERKKFLTRRGFGAIAGAGWITAATDAKHTAGDRAVLPGIWRARLGTPERLTPVGTRHYLPAVDGLAKLPSLTTSPLPVKRIAGRETLRGYRVRLPLAPGEMIYGLGLQFQSLLQRGRKKTLRVNADPTGDTGDSHAPVPFYVSSHGYGVFVDTARYLTIYCGSKMRKGEGGSSRPVDERVAADVAQLPQSLERFHMDRAGEILLEARGLDLYVFGGPSLREVVQRYNLFAGGGPLVPRWGLGFWYRAFGSANQQEILALAEDLRKEELPCDVLGLEPGWQSHSYSCSFTWSANFPKPHEMLDALKAKNFEVNLMGARVYTSVLAHL